MNFETYLYNKSKSIIESWEDRDVYVISFLVYAKEGISNMERLPEFSIGYNTEADCEDNSRYSEERWNYAFWRQNNIPIVDEEDHSSIELLLEWYNENGIKDIGKQEEEENEYDKDMNYIGKGPGGYYEFLMLVAGIARKLQLDGTVKDKFGDIPIIVHDLDYSWYIEDATLYANPNNEAFDFIKAYRNLFE